MGFSPETYFALLDVINKNGTELNDKISSKWEKGDMTIPQNMLADLDTSFSAASNKSLFSGYSAASYGCGWYGYKASANIGVALFFRGTSNVPAVCIATRTSDGWVAKTLI